MKKDTAAMNRIIQKIRYLKDFILVNGYDLDGNAKDPTVIEKEIVDLERMLNAYKH